MELSSNMNNTHGEETDQMKHKENGETKRKEVNGTEHENIDRSKQNKTDGAKQNVEETKQKELDETQQYNINGTKQIEDRTEQNELNGTIQKEGDEIEQNDLDKIKQKRVNGTKQTEMEETKQKEANESYEKLMVKCASEKVTPEQRTLIRQDTVVRGWTTCPDSELVSCCKFKLCCNRKRSSKNSACKTTVLVVLFLLSLIGTIIFFFTDTFNAALYMNLVLTNNSRAFELWRKPPIHPIMRVHIFNYTNAMEVLAGKEKKLRVEDIGPYVYEETLEHVNTEFHPNGTLSFQEKRSYQLLQDESFSDENVTVVVPNFPMLSAIELTKNSFYIVKVGLSTVFSSINSRPFIKLPLHRFLWGYDDDLIQLAKPYLQMTGSVPEMDNFGLLITRNGINKDVLSIFTGEKGMDKYGLIDLYNGQNRFNHWSTEECNRIQSTDGSMFPPSEVAKKQVLNVFNQQVCRQVPFVYQKEVELEQGIKALRFAVPEDVFSTPDVNPANQCYCKMESGSCPPMGVFNSSPCVFGAPMMSSFPHFYLGDPALVEAIDGLEPSPKMHAMYADLHPTLGFPIGANTKLQINVKVNKPPGITGPGLDTLPDGIILPFAWLELTMNEMPPEIQTIVYHSTYTANLLRIGLTWSCVLVLLITGFLLVLVTCRHFAQHRQSPLPVATFKF